MIEKLTATTATTAVATPLCTRAVGMHTNIEPAYPILASGLGIFSSDLSFDATSTIIHVPSGFSIFLTCIATVLGSHIMKAVKKCNHNHHYRQQVVAW